MIWKMHGPFYLPPSLVVLWSREAGLGITQKKHEKTIATRVDHNYPHDGYVGVSKNRGKPPKMDGLQWKSLLKWMIWGVPLFFGCSDLCP